LIIIDEERIFKEIEDKNPASVSVNGPDGILPQVQETAMNITKNLESQHMF
jgi:2-(3-amino-3-carboxypropyl)histidine synthase